MPVLHNAEKKNQKVEKYSSGQQTDRRSTAFHENVKEGVSHVNEVRYVSPLPHVPTQKDNIRVSAFSTENLPVVSRCGGITQDDI